MELSTLGIVLSVAAMFVCVTSVILKVWPRRR
jgi:hypothetical protein